MKYPRIIAGAAAVVALLTVSASANASWDWKAAKAQAPASVTATAPANSVTSGSIVDNEVNTFDIKDKSIGGWDVLDNTLPLSKMGWDFRQAIKKADVSQPGVVHEPALDAELKAKVNDKTGETAIFNFEAKPLAHTGGSFKTGKTKLGEFTLPAGTFKIDMSYFAHTLSALDPAAGTRPQLALRVGASATEFGADYGTLIGTEISPTADRELTDSGFKWILNNAPKTVEVFGFGYQDNTGDTSANKITMSAQVVLTRG